MLSRAAGSCWNVGGQWMHQGVRRKSSEVCGKRRGREEKDRGVFTQNAAGRRQRSAPPGLCSSEAVPQGA